MSRAGKKFGLSDDKFIDNIDKQYERAAQTQRIEIKTIPVSSISFEPGNPRKLQIVPKDIIDNLPDLQLPPAALEAVADKDWLEDYETLVTERFGTGKKKEHFLSLANFAAAMKSPDNLLHPIVVWREETRFFKITGERRLLAHILLGSPTIRATVWETKPDSFQLKRIQWDENIQRENLDLAEDLEALEGLLDVWKAQMGASHISLAQFMNISGLKRSNANRYLKILTSGTPALRQAITDHRIDALTTAFELASMEPQKADKKLAERLSGGADRVTLKEVQRERARQGERTRKRPPSRTPNFVNPIFTRRMRDDDTHAMGQMVKLLRTSIKGSPADKQIDELNLDRPKDVAVAFQKIFDYFKQQKKAGKG